MSIDREDLVARARLACEEAQRLEGLVFEMKVQRLLASAEHALIEHTPVLRDQLRLLLEHGDALKKP